MPSTSQSSSGQLSSGVLPSADKNYEHCFKIITPKRTYLVCAPSEEDEIKWLAALQCLVARKNQPQHAQSSSQMSNSTSTSTIATTAANANPPPVLAPPIQSPPLTESRSSGPPPTLRRGSSNAVAVAGDEETGRYTGHTRQRSVTDAARAAVREVERRYRPAAAGQA